jgi:hypothetical protein
VIACPIASFNIRLIPVGLFKMAGVRVQPNKIRSIKRQLWNGDSEKQRSNGFSRNRCVNDGCVISATVWGHFSMLKLCDNISM